MNTIGQNSKPPLGIAEDGPAIEVPSEVRYKYKIPIPIDSERKTVIFYPTSGNGNYTQNQTVKFNFAGNYADFANSYLAFQCIATLPATMRSPHDLFRTIKVNETATGRTIENLTDYNCLYEVMSRHTASEDYNPFEHSGITTGITIPAAVVPATAVGQYAIQPLSGLLRSSLYIPLKWMSGGLEVQFLISPDDECVREATGVGAGLIYSEFRYVVDMISLDSNFDTALGQWLSMSPLNQLNIPFATFTSHNGAANDQRPTLSITQQVRSLKAFYAVRRLETDLTSLILDKFNFVGAAISEFELRIGSQQHPNFLVPKGSISYNELMKSLGHMMDSQYETPQNDAATNALCIAAYIADSFVMGVNLERHTHDELFMMTGISTFTYSPILFCPHFTAAANSTLTAFLHFDGVLGVNFTGQCVIEY